MPSYPNGTPRLSQEEAIRFGRRIAAWRALHHLACWELAKDLGINVNSLSRLENGTRVTTVALAMEICAWTGMELRGAGVSLEEQGLYHLRRDGLTGAEPPVR
jgi:transcriptional regulator with XRE-family HTH domain